MLRRPGLASVIHPDSRLEPSPPPDAAQSAHLPISQKTTQEVAQSCVLSRGFVLNALPPHPISSQPVHQVPPTWTNHTSRYKVLDAHQDDPSTPPVDTPGEALKQPVLGFHRSSPAARRDPTFASHLSIFAPSLVGRSR
ncbi:hypothetical protein BJ322DRAFT_1019811 [Thelephora terrestris]|uniref:Uncharacterized protein n=1 Tax=Thelephora terrestris TaxID=56493 RepID=A0A9P6HII9_9AGAM|nr:hypothetical protein BJ322DRAFT_1019811 [Thelephora terrestris]